MAKSTTPPAALPTSAGDLAAFTRNMQAAALQAVERVVPLLGDDVLSRDSRAVARAARDLWSDEEIAVVQFVAWDDRRLAKEISHASQRARHRQVAGTMADRERARQAHQAAQEQLQKQKEPLLETIHKAQQEIRRMESDAATTGNLCRRMNEAAEKCREFIPESEKERIARKKEHFTRCGKGQRLREIAGRVEVIEHVSRIDFEATQEREGLATAQTRLAENPRDYHAQNAVNNATSSVEVERKNSVDAAIRHAERDRPQLVTNENGWKSLDRSGWQKYIAELQSELGELRREQAAIEQEREQMLAECKAIEDEFIP